MSRSRKILLVIVALAVLADFLPATRGELAWWWAESQNHSDAYLNYISDWPNGRHVAEARVASDERLRSEAKRAQIRQALSLASLAPSTNAAAVAARRLENAAKLDNFFWKKAAEANTVASYNNYLERFPTGRHAVEARQKMATPGLPADDTKSATPQ